MRDSKSDPHTTFPRTGVYDRPGKSSWGWGIGALVVLLALLALWVWGWDWNEVATAPAVPPAVTAPPAAAPVAPAARP